MVAGFDAFSTYDSDNAEVTSYSFTHTPVGTPTAVIVIITLWGWCSSFSPTYGGQALSFLGASASGDYNNASPASYFLVKYNPLAGPQTVAASWSVAHRVKVAVISLTGSDVAVASNAWYKTQPTTPGIYGIKVTGVANGIFVGVMHGEQLTNTTINSGTEISHLHHDYPNQLTGYILTPDTADYNLNWYIQATGEVITAGAYGFLFGPKSAPEQDNTGAVSPTGSLTIGIGALYSGALTPFGSLSWSHHNANEMTFYQNLVRPTGVLYAHISRPITIKAPYVPTVLNVP